ncbi:hypothetical protein CIB48_g5303 [Xylaria polymorpha]|nr:hypothetical protein CIB48_g5303 [Xylaria polymorpha]
MAASQKRLTKELQECMESPPPGDDDKPCVGGGPAQVGHRARGAAGDGVRGRGVQHHGDASRRLPLPAPQVNFATRIYHPNITNDSLGNICLGLLKAENWKPASRVRAVLEAVRHLLVEPNPDDPLEARIADEYRNNRPEFDKNVKSYVARYAKASSK